MNIAHYKPVIEVLFAYLGVWYLFLYSQAIWVWLEYFKKRSSDPSGAKLKTIKYGANPDRLVYDRTVGNTIEQSVPFLTSLLLSAAFAGDVAWTAKLGWSYVGVRLFYPLFFSKGLLVTVVTIPNYLSIFLLLYSVWQKL